MWRRWSSPALGQSHTETDGFIVKNTAVGTEWVDHSELQSGLKSKRHMVSWWLIVYGHGCQVSAFEVLGLWKKKGFSTLLDVDLGRFSHSWSHTTCWMERFLGVYCVGCGPHGTERQKANETRFRPGMCNVGRLYNRGWSMVRLKVPAPSKPTPLGDDHQTGLSVTAVLNQHQQKHMSNIIRTLTPCLLLY